MMNLEEFVFINKQIKSIWEVTDLGDPAKIIGIEIAISKNSIIISQEKYIEKNP